MTNINHEMLIAAGWNRMDEHPEEARPVMHALEDCSDADGAHGTINAVADLYRQAGWPESEIADALAYIHAE